VIEIDAASNTGVDNIRELIEGSRYKPMSARIKVYIIDEVHMLSKGAFNALLKTLEEPPDHVKFIFATTEVRRVPVTVLSRCQRFDLRRVDVMALVAHFQRIAAAEGATAEADALALIARAAEGSVRDGLSILDQAIAMGSGTVTLSSVRAMLGLADRGRVFDLLELLLSAKPADVLAAFDTLHKDGADPIQVLEDLAEVLHTVTRAKVAGADGAGEALSAEERGRAGALAVKLSLPLLSRAWQMLLKGIDEAGRSPDPRAAAAMVLIRIAHIADVPAPDELIRMLGGAPGRSPKVSDLRSDTVAQVPVSSGHGSSSAPTIGAQRPAAGETVSDQRSDTSASAEPPPVASLDDYGADPLEPTPDEEYDGDPDEAPAVPPRLADPRTFEEVVALVGEKRDARLKVHLEDEASLVRFDAAAGSIDLFLLPGAPSEMANELREKLARWTGRRWIVVLSKAKGAPPLGEVRRAREAAELDKVRQHPAVRAVLEAFPGAKVAARPMMVRKDDSGGQ
jgi:DNA polymerase-3 subunit gamma/tau